MKAVPETPQLARPIGETVFSLSRWASDLIRSLQPVLAEFGFRLNRVLPKDGTEAMGGPLKLKSYTTATRPAASDHAWSIIAVTDGAAGQKFQGSDGTSWVYLG